MKCISKKLWSDAFHFKVIDLMSDSIIKLQQTSMVYVPRLLTIVKTVNIMVPLLQNIIHI